MIVRQAVPNIGSTHVFACITCSIRRVPRKLFEHEATIIARANPKLLMQNMYDGYSCIFYLIIPLDLENIGLKLSICHSVFPSVLPFICLSVLSHIYVTNESNFMKLILNIYWPRRKKTCLRRFANNKGADQPARPRSLISDFVFRFLESIISKLATSEISIF